MKTHDFYFDLPEELIAQTPLQKRDSSRLLCLDKTTGETAHHSFFELTDFLAWYINQEPTTAFTIDWFVLYNYVWFCNSL